MHKELDEQLTTGTRAAEACARHLMAMGASKATIPVTVDGREFTVTVEYKEKS